MKYYFKSFFVLTMFVAIFVSCSEDEDPLNQLEGTYIRIFTEGNNTFQAELTFAGEGVYHWVPVGEETGHTASSAEYSISGNSIRIFNDSDCEAEAVYLFELTEGSLILTAESDECIARRNAMEGTWNVKS